MISEAQFQEEIKLLISNAIREDVGSGDYSSLACIPASATGNAKLLVKDQGIIAGVELAKMIFNYVDPSMEVKTFINDGAEVKYGDVVFHVSGSSQSILKAERLVLNSMQRMSAIATKTNNYVKLLEGTGTKVLDTRKTTPGFRVAEKWAVKIGGGENHRFALYDMIMLKDNHIDAAGGVTRAIEMARAHASFTTTVEIECENLDMVREAVEAGADIIMFDNMTHDDMAAAIELIAGRAKTECSGNVDADNIRALADLGVDYISSGALTHSAPILDLSLKHLRLLDGK